MEKFENPLVNYVQFAYNKRGDRPLVMSRCNGDDREE